MASTDEAPTFGRAFKFSLDASSEPQRPDAFVVELPRLRAAASLGVASQADGLDCVAPLKPQECEDIVTGDS